MPATPVRVQRPISRSQPVGPVKPKKLPKGHSFQGSRAQPVKKAEVPMPSGNPVGQLVDLPTPTEPQSPLDVIGAKPGPMDAISGKLPTEGLPDMQTLMQPAPAQWQSGNPAMSNIAASQHANKNMLAGRMPSGPRAATPVALPQGPAAGPGAGPGIPAPAAGPAAILAQPNPGLGKRGSVQPFDFGKSVADSRLLGKPEKRSAAFNFGTEISRTMKPKTVTRHEGEYRGNDMKTNLAKHGC
jgi:hypothetical protein